LLLKLTFTVISVAFGSVTSFTGNGVRRGYAEYMTSMDAYELGIRAASSEHK